MKLHTLISSSLLVLATSTSAYANNFSYNYVELGYAAITDFQVTEGIVIKGSYDLANNINVLGQDLTNNLNLVADAFVSTASDSGNVDADSYRIGVGYHTPLSSGTDVLAELGLFNVSAEAGNGIIKRDDSGYQFSAGIRHKLKEKIELQGRVNYKNSDDISERNYVAGARYYFKPNLSVGAEFNTGADDGSELLTTSLRWNFK